MKVTTKVLSQFLFQLYHKLATIYGYFPFFLDSKTNQFIPASKRFIIYSNLALLFQISMAVMSILTDDAIVVGIRNLNKTSEFLELLTDLLYYGLMLAIVLTAFFERNKILKTLNKVLVLNCLSLNGNTSLTPKLFFRLCFKVCFDIITTVHIIILTVYCTVYRSILLFTIFCLLVSVPVDGFLIDVYYLGFYYYGHLVESISDEFKRERKAIDGISVELDCLTKFHWSIMDSSKKFARTMQYIIVVSTFYCFISIVWAVSLPTWRKC